MNIDTSLNSGEISTKLSKINKIIAQITHQTPKDTKTMITKGQLDNYKLLVDQSIYNYKGTQTANIPNIILFEECNVQLHQVLRDYALRGVISYVSVSLFKDKQYSHKQMSLDNMISAVTPNTCLICFPIIDVITGKYLVNTALLAVIQQFKTKYSNIDLYIDMTQGLQYAHVVTNSHFPFDFWSFSSNQIHSTDKTGILGFKTSQSSRWNKFSSYIQKASDNSLLMHTTNELPAILNSLNVYLCNRDMKNKRIFALRQSIFQLLQTNTRFLNIQEFAFDSPTELHQYLNNQYTNQQTKKQPNIYTDLTIPNISKKHTKVPSSIVLFNCDKSNKTCIQGNILLLLVMSKYKNKLIPVNKDILISQFNKNQVVVDFIDPGRIFKFKSGIIKELSIIQICLNDLTFGFMIQQFADSLISYKHNTQS